MDHNASHNALPDKTIRNAALIVCEKSGHWALALRRSRRMDPKCLVETRSQQECLEVLADYPYSFVVAEVTLSNITSVYKLFAQIHQLFPHAAVAAAFRPDCRSFEYMLREAGAVHVIFSILSVDSVANMARRHLATTPMPELSWQEQIMSQLPW